MEFFSGVILSGICYDILKHHSSITFSVFKRKLSKWLVDDELIHKLLEETNKLSLNDGLSEKAIEKLLSNSDSLSEVVKLIEGNQPQINQVHSGSGDNVAGNKIVHK